MRKVKPIFLFADSQILFWSNKDGLFINRLRETIEDDENRPEGEITAVYIGASNGDKPEYYDIFTAAMKQIDITDCRHIKSKPTADDYSFLRTADMILLAGGDTYKGWNVIQKTELHQKIVENYHNGGLLIGISAGAIQLGMRGWKKTKKIPNDVFETFQLVPAVIDVHDEGDWEFLRSMVLHTGENNRGYGIPAGGGTIYHPDWSFEAIRHHTIEYSYLHGDIIRSLIFPKGEGKHDELPTEPNDHRGKVIKPDEIMTSGIINIDPEIIES